MKFVLSMKALTVISIITFILLIGVIICLILLLLKFKEYKNKYNKIFKKFSEENLEKDLESLVERLEKSEYVSNEAKIISESSEGKILKCVQKVGLVKYDAYNSGSNKLSFSLVLLDNNNTGVLLNSIYTRDGSNIYAKEILNGEYAGELSYEEKEALNQAMKHNSFM